MSRSRKALGLVALLVALAGAGYLAVRAHLERGIVDFGTQARVVAHELTTTTDSVSTSGVDQRYRVRREAVASMRTDLLGVATRVAMFITDSGYPRTYFNPQSPYQYSLSRENLLGPFTTRPGGMTATIASTMTSITCTIDLRFRIDTAAHPARAVMTDAIRQPVCTQQQ